MIAASIYENNKWVEGTSPYYFVDTFNLTRGKSGRLYWKGCYTNYWIPPFFSRQEAIEHIQEYGWLHLARADNKPGSFFWFKESDLS